MPFLNDIDADDESLQQPVRGVFAVIKDNLERVIAANIAWTLQILPALAAFAFPQLLMLLRVLLVLYSSTALAPASAILFVWMSRLNQNEPLHLEMLKEDLRTLTIPSLLRLAPLFGMLGACYMIILLLSFVPVLLFAVLARFALLVLLVCALYWGPLFVAYPGRSAFFLLRYSLRLVWRYPGSTALTALFVLLATALGIFSLGALFLIVPAVVALLQTRRCAALLAREHAHKARRSAQPRQPSPVSLHEGSTI